jgi:hypothetical protein
MNGHDLWTMVGAFLGAYGANLTRPYLSRAVKSLDERMSSLAERVSKLELFNHDHHPAAFAAHQEK